MFVYTETERLMLIDHLSLRIGNQLILRDVNAQIMQIERVGECAGQVVAFLGRSGRGKTQLFNCMAGLREPTEGGVYITEQNIPVRPGLVGVISQKYPLLPHKTVWGNLQYAADRMKLGKGEAKDKIQGYLERFHLMGLNDQLPIQLSGGQRQRVAIIQQLICSEHYLLMDEPFSGLDVVDQKEVASVIKKVANTDTKNTIIITGHNTRLVASVADIVWMLGFEKDASGRTQPGSTIRRIYDLKKDDLCWHDDIMEDPRFQKLVTHVENELKDM